MEGNRQQPKTKHADKYIFYVCLAAAVIIGTVSFILPPTGVIDQIGRASCRERV